MKQTIKQESNTSIASVFKATFQLWQESPAIVLLFILVALIDLTALMTLYWAPSEPVSGLLAPIIRTFWDERYLHYPENFTLLPKLFKHAHFLILCTFGLFASGVAIKQIEAHVEHQKTSLLTSAGTVFRLYFPLLGAWLACYAVFFFTLKGIMRLLPLSIPVQAAAGFAVSLVIQSLLIYVLPAILVCNQGYFKKVGAGLGFGIKKLVPTAFLISVPVLMAIGVSFAKVLSSRYVTSDTPEAVLWILMGSIVVSMIVDLFMTTATTLYFLKARNK